LFFNRRTVRFFAFGFAAGFARVAGASVGAAEEVEAAGAAGRRRTGARGDPAPSPAATSDAGTLRITLRGFLGASSPPPPPLAASARGGLVAVAARARRDEDGACRFVASVHES
jgi:hypothetical protein